MGVLGKTHRNNLSPRRGVAYFAPRNADGSYQSFIALSPAAEMALTQATETAEYVSQESGVNEILDTTVLSLNRTIGLTVNNLSQAIKGLFLVATTESITQASGTVTGELTPYVLPDTTQPLGGTVNNGGGIFGISAVTVEIYADARVNGATVAVGDTYRPAVDNDHVYMVTEAGVLAGAPPTFTLDGSDFADGTAQVIDLGAFSDAFTVETDYQVDLNIAFLHILATGAIADAIAAVPAEIRKTGKSIRLSVDYTRTLQTVSQLATREDANLDGAFMFVERNPKGRNDVWRCAEVSLSPTGDFSTKSGTEYGAVQFEITVKKPPAGPSMTQNGIPVGFEPT